jgi:hypothetical protein
MTHTAPMAYASLLGDVKARIASAQVRAALAANRELLTLYWEIGRLIDSRQGAEGWGAGVIPRLALDLARELPDARGFSERNLKRMVQYFRAYPTLGASAGHDPSTRFGPQAVAQGTSPQPPGCALTSSRWETETTSKTRQSAKKRRCLRAMRASTMRDCGWLCVRAMSSMTALRSPRWSACTTARQTCSGKRSCWRHTSRTGGRRSMTGAAKVALRFRTGSGSSGWLDPELLAA